MKFFVIHIVKLPATGMAIYPFIMIKDKAVMNDQVLINHEKIHLKQQLELLILPFYVAYLIHYAINLIIYKSHHQAYMNIVFEREAYLYESSLEYLDKRPFFAWSSLLFKN